MKYTKPVVTKDQVIKDEKKGVDPRACTGSFGCNNAFNCSGSYSCNNNFNCGGSW